MNLWPHQTRGIADTLAAIEAGERRVLLTSPTGGGKTRMACGIIEEFVNRDLPCVLYSNRKMMVDQTSKVLANYGLSHGVRAAGHEDKRHELLQVSSIQTEQSRVMRRKEWSLHDAKLVLIDEAHIQKGEGAAQIMEAHVAAGAHVVGITATPIGLGDLYTKLIVAGNMTELRGCGALVPCLHYGPDEPDLRKLKGLRPGEDLTENQAVKAMMTPTIWGRVWEWFEKLNPEHKPTILFAPGVRESLWFAEQFVKKGVGAAHIDGEDCWINGKLYRSDREARREVLDGSKGGDITTLCNRFVLREGIDAPWLRHGIFATVFGSLQSYLQSGGRLLRAYPGMDAITLQDHGGNWWRHGSLNADRLWDLEWSAGAVTGLREMRLREKKEHEPWRCPQCGLILLSKRCRCGFEFVKRSRPVVSAEGELIEMNGDIFRPRSICKRPDGPAIWERMYHRSRTKKGERTFSAAMALFAYENYWQWPDRSWPFMPVDDVDLFRNVADVPRERLVQPCMTTS